MRDALYFGLLWASATVATPAHAQERPDSASAIPINPITVSVLRGPIEAGREPYAVSSLGSVALQQG